MVMATNKIDSFNKRAERLFQTLVDKYGYVLSEVNIQERNGQKWSTHLIYTNAEKNLKIEIRQAPYYTDYGFSFFIYKMGTNEYNILYHVPHENQDSDNQFLINAHKDLFSTDETIDLMSGKSWRELKHIPFQTNEHNR